MLAKKTKIIEDISSILSNSSVIAEIRENIKQGDVYILKRVIDSQLVTRLRDYLESVGRNSLPNYYPIEFGCPNHHRVNYDDERAFVKGCFHQFSFFPWNQDVFNLFTLCREVYMFKNAINNISRDKFLGRTPDDDCIARIAFQFYPAGAGHLNMHADPVDRHQLVVPILSMSKKGRDFHVGGAYVVDESQNKIYTDEISDPGDLVLFDAVIHHGVDLIDPDEQLDWTSFRGRWMMLLATNKLSSNNAIADAVDLEK